MKAYHFVHKTLRDGQDIPEDGEWLEHEGAIELCKSGLHASIKLRDALSYAPGSTLCRVELEGDILKDADKLVGRRRKILWRVDFQEGLRAWTRWCAIQVLDKWEAPQLVKDFLRTGKNAASSAAYTASRAAYAASRAAYAASASACERKKQNKALKEFLKEARSGIEEWELTW